MLCLHLLLLLSDSSSLPCSGTKSPQLQRSAATCIFNLAADDGNGTYRETERKREREGVRAHKIFRRETGRRGSDCPSRESHRENKRPTGTSSSSLLLLSISLTVMVSLQLKRSATQILNTLSNSSDQAVKELKESGAIASVRT